jgi:hypothetical protein
VVSRKDFKTVKFHVCMRVSKITPIPWEQRHEDHSSRLSRAKVSEILSKTTIISVI